MLEPKQHPGAPPPSGAESMSLLAVVTGLILYFIITTAVSGVLVYVHLSRTGESFETLADRVEIEPGWWDVLDGVISVLCMTFCGWLTAVIAKIRKKGEMKSALALGLAETVLFLPGLYYTVGWSGSRAQLVTVAAQLLLMVPAAMCGAKVRILHREKADSSRMFATVGAIVAMPLFAGLASAVPVLFPAPRPAVDPSTAPKAPEPPPETTRKIIVDRRTADIGTETVTVPDGAGESFPLLEGDSDAGYRAVDHPGTPFGGAEPAPTWRSAAVVDQEGDPSKHFFAVDARRVAVGSPRSASIVLLEAGKPARKLDARGPIRHFAFSGNRLIVAREDPPSLVAHDLDRDQVAGETIALPGPDGCVAACADDPRRVYVLAGGTLHLVDAGRMIIVASHPLRDVNESREALRPDGRGLLVCVLRRSGSTVLDAAAGFKPVTELPRDFAHMDPNGRLLFTSDATTRVGSSERCSSGGKLIGRLPDGALLVHSPGRFERRDPETGKILGETLPYPGFADDTADPPGLSVIPGRARLLRYRLMSKRLEVLDLPAWPAARPLRPRLVLASTPREVHLGEEWSWTPPLLEPRGASVVVSGPSDLRWDGTTARWLPRERGEQKLKVSATPRGGERVTLELSVKVEPRRIEVEGDQLVSPRALESGELVVWSTAKGFHALEVATWRVRSLAIPNVRGIAESGDSLWLAAGDGLIELSCPGLVPRGELRPLAKQPSGLTSLPDGRIGWAEFHRGPPEVLQVFRLRPGPEPVCENVTLPYGGGEAAFWLDSERFVAGQEGAEVTIQRWGEDGRIGSAGKAFVTPQRTKDGPVFLTEKVLRPDGRLLRAHPLGNPQPSHDGAYYVALDRGKDPLQGTAKAVFHALPDGRPLGVLQLDPLKQGSRPVRLLLLSRLNRVVLVELGNYGTALLVHPYDPAAWTR